MKKRVCISGGTGLIGTAIAHLLNNLNYSISFLSRNSQSKSLGSVVKWDIENGIIQPGGLDDVGHIIHLAGESVASGRWTKERKKSIRDSRIKSTRLLYNTLKDMKSRPSTFIAASAIGVYGHHTGGVLVDENRNMLLLINIIHNI